MPTYCISDIHGHKDEFGEMLAKIDFDDNDELWVLGDIIDKGPKSAEMLIWAVDEAPSNVHFLMGNHEEMMLEVLRTDPVKMWMPMMEGWGLNGGIETSDALRELTSAEWRKSKLVPWLESLDDYAFVDVNYNTGTRKIALVHAGFDPYGFSENENSDTENDGEMNELIKNGFGYQSPYYMHWIRLEWLMSSRPAPLTTIHGHTYITSEITDKMNELVPSSNSIGGNGRIFRCFNRYDIDCGCAQDYIAKTTLNDSTRKKLNDMRFSLGCLRLDDMEEFYVEL